MPSEVDVINMALGQLGQLSISTRIENTKQAREANRIFDQTRDNELRIHIWNFAVKRVVLPALVTVPAFGYSYAYQLPDDYIRVIQAGDFPPGSGRGWWWWGGWGHGSEASEYRIEGRTIVTDYGAPLSLRYLARIIDPNLWDASFVSALACRLAMRLCETMTGASNKRQEAGEEYKESVTMAIRANAIEMPPEQLPPSSWELSRRPGW